MNKIKSAFKNLVFSILMLSLSGCAILEPWVSDINIVSVPQEVQIGQQAAAQIKTQKTLINDERLTRVRKIGSRLVQALPAKEFTYTFYVVEDASPNAFTIPGGSIYIHTGLLKFVSSDDELAGVMGHEIGHAYLRHPAKAMTRQYGLDYLGKVVFKENTAGLKGVAMNLAANSILTRYGREDELQADEVGYLLSKKSGYDPQGLLSFFKKLQTLEGGGFTIPFLSTHPPTPERIARMQALIRGAKPVEIGNQQNF